MVYTIINNKNLDMLHTKDVKKIVLFRMDMCSHCDSLKKVWNIIKKKYKDNIDIQIYEIEKNILHDVHKDIRDKISGFPTIAILKGNKVIKEFTATRTLENIDKFILSIKPLKL